MRWPGAKKKFKVRIQMITACAHFFAPRYRRWRRGRQKQQHFFSPFFRHDFFFRASTRRRRRFLHKAAYFSRPPSILEHHPKIGIGATKKRKKSKLCIALAGCKILQRPAKKYKKNIFPFHHGRQPTISISSPATKGLILRLLLFVRSSVANGHLMTLIHTALPPVTPTRT